LRQHVEFCTPKLFRPRSDKSVGMIPFPRSSPTRRSDNRCAQSLGKLSLRTRDRPLSGHSHGGKPTTLCRRIMAFRNLLYANKKGGRAFCTKKIVTVSNSKYYPDGHARLARVLLR
jgi:hypothetical protein